MYTARAEYDNVPASGPVLVPIQVRKKVQYFFRKTNLLGPKFCQDFISDIRNAKKLTLVRLWGEGVTIGVTIGRFQSKFHKMRQIDVRIATKNFNGPALAV